MGATIAVKGGTHNRATARAQAAIDRITAEASAFIQQRFAAAQQLLAADPGGAAAAAAGAAAPANAAAAAAALDGILAATAAGKPSLAPPGSWMNPGNTARGSSASATGPRGARRTRKLLTMDMVGGPGSGACSLGTESAASSSLAGVDVQHLRR